MVGCTMATTFSGRSSTTQGPVSAVESPFRSRKTLQVLRRGENVVRIYWRGASGGMGEGLRGTGAGS